MLVSSAPFRRRVFPAMGMLLLLSVVAASATAQSPQGWALSAGGFDVIDSDKAIEAGLEYRFKPFTWWKLELMPMAGVTATSEGNAWGYAGLRYDLKLGTHWFLTPNFSAGFYERGDGKDLGGNIQFRSGLEVSYRFDKGTSLGLSFYHLSNARLEELNPGSESLVLVYSFGR